METQLRVFVNANQFLLGSIDPGLFLFIEDIYYFSRARACDSVHRPEFKFSVSEGEDPLCMHLCSIVLQLNKITKQRLARMTMRLNLPLVDKIRNYLRVCLTGGV